MLATTDLELLQRDGCKLATPNGLLVQLTQEVGDPCTTGCSYYNGGKCPAFRLHNTRSPHRPPEVQKGLTMKQIANKYGISLNEARRRKLHGTL